MKCKYCGSVLKHLEEGKSSDPVCLNCLLTKQKAVIKDKPETRVDLNIDPSDLIAEDYRSTEFDDVHDEIEAYAIEQSNK